MSTKFLIAIPTFNRANLIPALISSIEQQEYENYDVLFVDDCSSDDTQSIIRNFYKDNSKIHYHRLVENSGVNTARNKILDIAKKDFPDSYIVFIDDDDLLVANCLNKANIVITQNPEYNWISFNCITPDGIPISKIKEYGKLNYIDDYMFGRNIRGDLTHIVKVSIIGNCRFTSLFKNAEIWYFWCQLAQKTDLHAINAIGSIKEYLPEGITNSNFNRNRTIEVSRMKIQTLEPLVGRYKLRHQYVTLAKNLIEKNQKKEALSILFKVFKSAPFYFRQYRHWVKALLL